MKYTFILRIGDTSITLEVYRKTLHTIQPGESFLYAKQIRSYSLSYFPFTKLIERFRHREIISIAKKLREQDNKHQARLK